MDVSADTVVGAFSEEQVAALSGVSLRQLQSWARTGFYKPSYASDKRAFARIYSFRDLVSLRVLNALRNVNNVSMQELRKTASALRHFGEQAWSQVNLWVFRGKVLFKEPETGKLREVAGRQYVAAVCVEVEIEDTLKVVHEANERKPALFGEVVRNRHVMHRAPVIAGTRIPISAIRAFHEAGYDTAAILAEYPDLVAEDVAAAIAYKPAA